MKSPIPSIKIITLFILCFLFINISCTQVLGQKGIRLNTPDAYDGYKLCTTDANRTYLLDNCGKIVNTWTNTIPRYYCRLTEEGNLIYIFSNRIFERDWNNNIVNNININSNDLILDYEVMKLKNGNFLAACRRIRNSQYFDALGWNPNKIKPDRTDGVVEIDPNGNIVWEWNIGDHTIQDQIPTASNYGNVKDHPELVDINTISDFDWQFQESFMINSIDYNQELDQILISVRKVSEFMVIDHSTTTQEAKGSTGGNAGKGGDILYRWGNPQNYKQGNHSDRVLYYQHNPNWIKYGDHVGKIIVYNNGLDRFVPGIGSMSSVHIVNPPLDENNNYTLEDGEAYLPNSADITIDELTTGNEFYSGYTSGAQVLPNGNIYITVGLPAEFIEVKTDGTEVWEFALANTIYIFRSEQYPRDFPGFEGKDMSSSGTVESPSSTYDCEIYTSTSDIESQDHFTTSIDQITGLVTIRNMITTDNILQIRDAKGQIIQTRRDVKNNDQISLGDLPLGIYYFTIYDKLNRYRTTQKVLKYF